MLAWRWPDILPSKSWSYTLYGHILTLQSLKLKSFEGTSEQRATLLNFMKTSQLYQFVIEGVLEGDRLVTCISESNMGSLEELTVSGAGKRLGSFAVRKCVFMASTQLLSSLRQLRLTMHP